MFEPSAGSGGMVLQPKGEKRGTPGKPPPGTMATGMTDEDASLVPGDLDAVPADPLVRAKATEIMARLAIPRPRTDRSARRGSGTLASMRYSYGSDEIDLDRTLEVLAEKPFPDDEDIIVRDRVRTRRAVVLAVDVSGSMKGERMQSAAATVGALSAELQRDALGVIAFWSDAAVLLDLGRPIRPLDLLDTMLQMPARGLTNVSFPLELAAQQLSRVPARDARVILLSDCVHNAGPDPRIAAARLPRLDVLIDVSGEKDIELGRELAASGHGTAQLIRTYRDVAPALSALFIT
ncbi:vWA domain-containing protein [Lacisediminihabitans changchengi]|uniref:VWA domain-containing protein n=1 Tax=Lacisediminihabitans changchengi TaxID=2787634 RepID=A0A934ST78_9MICO|nr:vWA domain-containing protein [Lacisediminihabitans changchengi]MBK4348563.1 VWA domain-containing protein [Lacisediminihabitans changchengi]